ncbi:methyl-accepting chemotaxis protein [Candidatus Solincola tengchongensis]|uniref:methyl-accepting chemotaxis protein n=1 Tax=Candidatus Solincola tengchongensis TaxID=2900693 RepID=UPI0025802605|nr:methyl-accepting chemotaxis protein [Candidatus Solincola tengchongensis]
MRDEDARRTQREELEAKFDSASRRLLAKASLSAVTIPLVVLALFSLTIFRFTARQYLVYLLAVASVVLPMAVLLALTYLGMQRSILRRLRAWYDRPRDPAEVEDRLLAVQLQKILYGSGFRHGLIVAAGIFLSLALSVALFGRYADFTPYLTVSYIFLGFLLGLVDFLVTVFLSHREMRPVMGKLLEACHGFGYYTVPGTGRRLMALSLVVMLLTLGIAWIASAYLGSDLLREEMSERCRENLGLLATRLSEAIKYGDAADLEEAMREAAPVGDMHLAVLDAAGEVNSEYHSGDIEDGVWKELVSLRPTEIPGPISVPVTLKHREYLVTFSPMESLPGWMVVRAEGVDPSFHTLWRLTPTMLLLLLVSAGVAAFLTLVISRNISDPMRRLVGCCRVVASGDLDVEVPVDSLDDLGELSTSYAEMLESLRSISLGLRETSGEVSEGAESIVAVSQEFMAAIEELNALVQDLSGQIEDEVQRIREVEEIMLGVAETISMSHSQASRTLEIGRDAEKLVQEGRECAREAVQKIADFKELLDTSMEAVLSLGESSKRIDTIVEVIARIADQTNLLALNAAIEAARVPEHGRGFAVVADEVKKLAQEAAASAHRISDQVRAIQKDVERTISLMEKGTMGMYVGMETVARTDSSLASISDVVGQMARMAESIARASAEELKQSERLAASLEAMQRQVESTAQAYEEIGSSSEQQTQVTAELTGTAEKLAEIAHRLQDMVSRFKVSPR